MLCLEKKKIKIDVTKNPRCSAIGANLNNMLTPCGSNFNERKCGAVIRSPVFKGIQKKRKKKKKTVQSGGLRSGRKETGMST